MTEATNIKPLAIADVAKRVPYAVSKDLSAWMHTSTMKLIGMRTYMITATIK